MKPLILFLSFIFSVVVYSDDSTNQKDKRLFFISPSDGDVVSNPVKIRFGVIGMKIVPAGINEPSSGHHHLLINVKELPNMKLPIPADKNHIHFGKGQTETDLNLPKGKHTLQLLLGNYLHIPHNKPLISDKIHIIVK